jgi:hypothetical protein
MQSDPGTEWERLTRLYGEKSDEELVDLSEDFGNLTEVAQQVLRDEMRKRGEGAPQTTSRKASEGRADGERKTDANESAGNGDDVEAVEYTWKTPLCECNDYEQAWQIAEVLRRAGIRSWPDRPGSTFGTRTLGSRFIRLLVAADEVEEARAITAKPIPQDVIDQYKIEAEAFEPPTCPKCGAADPLLESVEPSNNWLCESCGARWSDPGAVENGGQNQT